MQRNKLFAGATPLFIDVDLDTMGLSPIRFKVIFFKRMLRKEKMVHTTNLSGKKISACVPMHTFGFPCRIKEITKDMC